MSDRPYTDADLRHEAARLHARAATKADELIRPLVQRKWGEQADPEAIDEACDEIVTLLDGAADVSDWAITLGAARLRPVRTHAVRLTTGGYPVAVHIAIDPELTDAARDELTAELTKAITVTVSAVLGCAPVTEA